MTTSLFTAVAPAIESVANHLWQSTVFAAAAGVLAVLFRHNRAQVRYWIWLAASVKFLVPCAALIALGSAFAWRVPAPMVSPDFTSYVDAVSQPFSQPALGLAKDKVALGAEHQVRAYGRGHHRP